MSVASARARKIAKAVGEKFDKGLVRTLQSGFQLPCLEGFSWGLASLNHICTGDPTIGLVRGRIYELYGPLSGGKTTLCLHAVREVQCAGGVVAFIDSEHALDPRYAVKLGVLPKDVLFCQPDNGEEAMTVAEEFIKEKVDLIIFDSVAALTPKAVIEGKYDKNPIGIQARFMSQSLAKLHKIIAKNKCVALFTNQVRFKIGVMFGSPETTPGGEALGFYASVRLRSMVSTASDKAVKGQGSITGEKDIKRLGSEGTIRCVKNKIYDPFGETTIPLYYGRGFDAVADVYKLAARMHLITHTTGGYRIPGVRLVVKYAGMEEHVSKVWTLIQEGDRGVIEVDAEVVDDEPVSLPAPKKKTVKKKAVKKKTAKKKVAKKTGRKR